MPQPWAMPATASLRRAWRSPTRLWIIATGINSAMASAAIRPAFTRLLFIGLPWAWCAPSLQEESGELMAQRWQSAEAVAHPQAVRRWEDRGVGELLELLD